MKIRIGIQASIKFFGIALVLLMQFSQSSLAQQSESSLVKLEAGTEYELSNVQPESTIRIPVTIQAGVTTIAVSLVDVAIGTRHDQTLFQAFCVRMEAVQPGVNQVPAMLVTSKAAGLEQGKYELLVRAQSAEKAASGDCAQPSPVVPPPSPPAEQPTGTKTQFIKINLTLPAAKLQSSSPLTVEQVVPLFGEPQTLGSPSLLLWETSGHKTRLTGIAAKQLDIPSGVNQPTNGKINFEPPAEVAPGEVVRAPLKLSGSFPLGSTKGTALVVSPQLSEPLSVSFEIKARRSQCVIVIVMILGLLAGFFLRIWSKDRIELNEARQKALNFADTFEQELQRRPDAIFQKRVRVALDTLRALVAHSKAEALVAGVTAANTALANAMTDLDNRRALGKDQLAAFARLTHTDWLLPAEVANAFKVDEQELAQANLEIENEDVFSAKDRLARLSAKLGGDLGPAVSRWRNETKSFLDALSSIAVLISAKGSDRLTQETTAISAKLDAIQATAGDATVEQVIAMLTAWRDAQGRINDLLSIVQIALKSTAEVLREQFDQVDAPDVAAIAKLITALDAFQKTLPDAAAHPGIGAVTLPAKVNEITSLWCEAMLKQVTGRSDVERQINDRCEQGDFSGAAATVIRSLKPVAQAQAGEEIEEVLLPTFVSDATVTFGTRPLIDGLLSMLSGKSVAQDVAIPRTTRERTLLLQLEALRVSTRWELLWVKLLRFGISSLVILVVGYALFADKLVGTLSDLLAVFFWGFGIDIGVDAVAEVGKKVKQ